MFRTWVVVAAGSMLALGAGACGNAADAQFALGEIGPAGGTITSIDSILTIAIQPGALEETITISVEPSDGPPEILGPAFLVRPNVELAIPATITYRFDLPEDNSETGIGYIDLEEFEQGRGRWRSLPIARLDASQNLVTATDDKLNLFYGLLGDATSLPPPTSDTTGDPDTGTPMTSVGPGSATTGPDTDQTTAPGSTGDGLLPRCQNLPATRMVATEFVFDDMPLEGEPEDLAFTSMGTFIVRNGPGLVEIDAAGTVTDFPISIPFTGDSLGTRWTVNNTIVTMTFYGFEANELLEIQLDGTVNTLVSGLEIGNGIFAALDGNIFYTDFFAPLVAYVDETGAGQIELGAGGNEAPAANGVVYDADRALVFYVCYSAGLINRVDLSNPTSPGDPQTIATIESLGGGDAVGLDGVAMDDCGNLYIIDENNFQESGLPGSMYRLQTNVNGSAVGAPELVVPDFPDTVSNLAFAQGPGWEDYPNTLFVVGIPGRIFTVDVGMEGAPTPAGG